MNYFPVFLRVLLKVLVTNYGSPGFWRTLFSAQKQSLNSVLLKKFFQNTHGEVGFQ